MGKNLVILIVVCGLAAIGGAQDDGWKQRRDKNGITLSTRDVEWSRYHEYKVEMETIGSIEGFYSVLKDFSVYQELFRDVKSFDILLDQPDRHVVYLVNKTPFPAKDRDVILDNKFTANRDLSELTIAIACESEYDVPIRKYIRIERCSGFWKATKVANGKVRIEHQFVADPGGSIPAFIVNIKTVQNPLKTMDTLREMLVSSKYEDKTLFLSFVQQLSR